MEWITEEVTEQGELQRGQQWPGAVMEEKLVASPAVCWRPFSGREGWRMKAMNGGPLSHVCTAGGQRQAREYPEIARKGLKVCFRFQHPIFVK